MIYEDGAVTWTTIPYGEVLILFRTMSYTSA